jgi:hypothetical protein
MITERQLATPETLIQWKAEAVAKVDEAVSIAQKEAAPDGAQEDWCALSDRELTDHAESVE